MTPHVTIVGNGPSARLYGNAAHGREILIAVNWAAELVAADYWCFVDWDTFAHKTPGLLGKPAIFCGSEVIPKLRERAPDRLPALFEHDLRIYPSRPGDGCCPYWAHKSGLVALAFALSHTEVLSIDLYGYDMSGDNDCRGDTNDHSRYDKRWENERVLFARLAHEAADAGVELTRYLDDGQETRHESEAVAALCP